MPSLDTSIKSFVISVLMLIGGYIVFKKIEKLVADVA
jgi:hypothetical protein